MKKTVLIVAGCVLGAVVAVKWIGIGKTASPGPSAEKMAAVIPEAAPAKAAVLPVAPEATPRRTNSLPVVAFKAEKTDQMPESLRTVLGLDEKKDYFTRIKAVHKLGKNLSQAEINALYLFLNRKNGEDNLSPQELDALKNDVSMAILGQSKKSSDYANNLIAMYADNSHDDVWRDYCIQHLGAWYSKAETAEKPLIAAALWDAAGQKQLPIAGTALIALSNNTDDGNIDRAAVADKAFEMCSDDQCGELAKTTALQISAKLGDKRTLPIARMIADSGASVPLRMSALAAVGTLGDSTDRPMLEKYASSTDVRLRKSAQGALGRLK